MGGRGSNEKRRLARAGTLALIGLLTIGLGSTRAACEPTADQISVGVRALQTELMVAGIKCSAERWNSFARQFKTTIKSDADRLQLLFRKTYGKGGADRMNAFVTQLANDASQRSNGATEADYCRQEDVLFQKVLALTGSELERFSVSRALAVPAPVALCAPDDAPPATTVAAIHSGSIGPH